MTQQLSKYTTLANVSSSGSGTFNYYLDMDGYKYVTFQSAHTAGSGTVTMTFEATTENNVASGSATYVDVGSKYLGAASLVNTSGSVLDFTTPINFRWIKVKIVCDAGGSAASGWKITAKQNM